MTREIVIASRNKGKIAEILQIFADLPFRLHSLADFPDDPACQTATSPKENPKCDDGLDNDGDGEADWDGAGLGAPDAQCVGKPWRDRETASSCGLGTELTIVLAALRLARRRRRR